MVARHANINNVLAMRLTRMDDARGRPFMVHLARCNRWPRGLDLGMMDSGNRGPDYCFSTFRESGSMDDAVTAHQRRGNRGGGVRPGGSGDGDGWAGNCAADHMILQSHVQRSCGPSSTNEIDKIKVRCGFAVNFVVRP